MKLLVDGTPSVKYDKDCKIVDLVHPDWHVSIDMCNMESLLTEMLTAYKQSFKDAEQGDEKVLDLAIDVMDYDLLEEFETTIKNLEDELEDIETHNIVNPY